jgi:hypothetical protein
VKLGAALLAALVLAPLAGAATGTRAMLTSTLPEHAAMGSRIVVTFTLQDAAGHPFDARKVFVKITCPEKTDSSFVYAARVGAGRYRAVAYVPPGGLGTIRIGARGSTDVYFPITNH